MSNIPHGVGSVHAWGFFNVEGERMPISGIAVSDLSPYHHHRQVERNVTHFGGTIVGLRVTRTLDGLLVSTEFVTPAHDATARMWHVITKPSEPWPDPTRRPDIHLDDPRAALDLCTAAHGCASTLHLSTCPEA